MFTIKDIKNICNCYNIYLLITKFIILGSTVMKF